MSLQTAIKELAEYLADGEDPQAALEEIAEEYGLNPVLLRRKFKEQHGVDIENYADKAADREATNAAAEDSMIRRAKERAENIFNTMLTGPRGDLGTIFEVKGEKYAFIGYVNSRKGPKVWAVRVKSDNPTAYVHWTGRASTEIMKIVTKAAKEA